MAVWVALALAPGLGSGAARGLAWGQSLLSLPPEQSLPAEPRRPGLPAAGETAGGVFSPAGVLPSAGAPRQGEPAGESGSESSQASAESTGAPIGDGTVTDAGAAAPASKSGQTAVPTGESALTDADDEAPAGSSFDGETAEVAGRPEQDDWLGEPALDDQTGEPEPPLPELLAMVEEGRGHAAYPLLLARIPLVLEQARLRGDETAALDAELGVLLLRAGEGLAPAEIQEQTARRLIGKYPDAESFPLAFFYLTRALFAQGKPLENSFFFDAAAFAALPAWMRSSTLTMKSKAAAREGNLLVAAGFLLEEMELNSGPRAARPDDVEALLERVADREELDAFLDVHGEVGWLTEAAPFLRVRAAINRGDFSAALLGIDRILREGLLTSPARIKAIHAARADIEARILISARKIGVLLPLSSSSSALRALSLETLDGLRMALRALDSVATGEAMATGKGMATTSGKPARLAGNFTKAAAAEGAGKKPARGGRGFELVIRDTGNNLVRAARMVEELANEEHVMAIVGPIARSESAAAAEAAERLGVPIISLSLTMEPPPEARYVFRHSKGQAEEIRDLVRYAMDYAGASRFVLLYPKSAYGTKITELFWEAVEKKGGRIVGAESYRALRKSPLNRVGETGLKEIFDRFTGRDRPQEAEDIALQEALGDNGPDPILDFDAIFIPIGPRGSQDLRFIAPYPVTVDAEKALLLGNRFWNNDEVIVAGGGRLNGAVFVDAFDRMGMDPRLRDFRRRHRIMFGHRAGFRPPSYYTAFGYDTLRMLMLGITRQTRPTREGLARWLVDMEPYPGVTGLTTFLESGEAVKESMFFRLEKDRIRRITP